MRHYEIIQADSIQVLVQAVNDFLGSKPDTRVEGGFTTYSKNLRVYFAQGVSYGDEVKEKSAQSTKTRWKGGPLA